MTKLVEEKYEFFQGSHTVLLSEHSFRVGLFGPKKATDEQLFASKLITMTVAAQVEKSAIVTGILTGVGKAVADSCIAAKQPCVAFLPRPIFRRKSVEPPKGTDWKAMKVLNFNKKVVDLSKLQTRDPDEVYHEMIVETGGAVLSTFQEKDFLLSEKTMISFYETIVGWADCFIPVGLDSRSDVREDRWLFGAAMHALRMGKPLFLMEGVNNEKVCKMLKEACPPLVITFEFMEELEILLKGTRKALLKEESNNSLSGQ